MSNNHKKAGWRLRLTRPNQLTPPELNFFHTSQQCLQAILPAVLLFAQLVVFALQFFTAVLSILNFLGQGVVFIFKLFNLHLQQGDGVDRLLYFRFQFLKHF